MQRFSLALSALVLAAACSSGGGAAPPSPLGCTPPPAGLAGWWPFNEPHGTIAADISGGGHHATHVNGPTATTTARVGHAVTFDGIDSYSTAGHDPTLDPGTTFSIDFWIRPDNAETAGTIYRKGKLSPSHDILLVSPGFHLYYSNGHLIGFFSGASGSLLQDLTPPTTFHADPGLWTFVALTVDLDAGQAILYVNGQPTKTTPLVGIGPISNAEPVIIGGSDDAPSASRSFSGIIDELEFFTATMPESDVAAIFAAGPSGKCGSPNCKGPQELRLSSGDGTAAFHPDEAGALFGCNAGSGDAAANGIRFDPDGPLPDANQNCSTALYVFDQAGTRRQVLSVHPLAQNSCPCAPDPGELGLCFYEPLCGANDVAHLTCPDVTSLGVSFDGTSMTTASQFSLPNFPGLTVQVAQHAFADRLEQTYSFLNFSQNTYHLRLTRVADGDLGYLDDGTATGVTVAGTGGYVRNVSKLVPFGAAIHDNTRNGAVATPKVTLTITAPEGGTSTATFEGARLQGDGGSAHGRVWWNYGVPSEELNVYGRDGNYWTTTWSGDPATPGESDQAVIVQSLLSVAPKEIGTYVTVTQLQ